MPTTAPDNLRATLQNDLERYLETARLRGQATTSVRVKYESWLFKPGFQAVLLFRLSHWLFKRKMVRLAWLAARLNQFLTAAEMEFNAQVGPGLLIAHPAGIVLGRGSVLGRKVTLFQGVTLGALDWHPARIGRFPRVGDNVFIFAGAKILGDIALGDNVVVGANAVVTTDVPAGAMVVGNPACILPHKGAELIRSWGLDTVGQ